MSLSSEYGRQYRWRPWPQVFAALPPIRGQTVLDLGCGIGDQAAELVARGARVIGVDANEQLLREAMSKALPSAEFRSADLRSLQDLESRPTGSGAVSSPPTFRTLPPHSCH